jgi:hypothetical protein
LGSIQVDVLAPFFAAFLLLPPDWAVLPVLVVSAGGGDFVVSCEPCGVVGEPPSFSFCLLAAGSASTIAFSCTCKVW